jgi:DNA/RNA endonuclease G (NUC1)
MILTGKKTNKRLFILWVLLITVVFAANAQKKSQLCSNCMIDTTGGGYISIEDTVKRNPILNYELLTGAHLVLTHQLKISRAKIPFFPHNIDVLYVGSGYSRGHVIPYEDLAWSPISAKASMNEKRNLAPQPQNENIGTKLACEDTCRLLATQYKSAKVYSGTWGSLGLMKGINKPQIYWTLVIANNQKYIYWMPTTGDKIGFHNLKDTHISFIQLTTNLGFDPTKILN